MNRFARFAVVAAVVFLSGVASSAQMPDPCPSVQWTPNPPLFELDDDIEHLASVDYDEDGKLDLVGETSGAGGPFGNLVWWKGEGDGTFRMAAVISVPAAFREGFFSNLVIADATGDGLSDVVATLSGGYQTPPRLVILPATGSGRGPALVKTLRRAGSLTAVQRDADPAVELIVHPFGRSFDIYDDVAGTATLVASVETEMEPTGIAGADFDGDGHLDIAVAMRQLVDPALYVYEAALRVYYGRLDGTFETPVAYRSRYPYYLAAGDLNEDGRPDFVAGNLMAPATVSVFLNQGGRNFIASEVSLIRLSEWGVGDTVLLEDVSGDGHLDLIAGTESSPIAIAVGRGDGTFLTPTFQSLWGGSPAIGDFDDDGTLDLAMGRFELAVATTICATQVSLGTPASLRYINNPYAMAILPGQPLDLRVEISGFGPPRRNGRVILRDGATVLDSAPVGADGTASFTVPGLALGYHPLTAEFSGDRFVPAASSNALAQWVTGPTPIALKLPDILPVYGEPLPVLVTVVSSGWWNGFNLDIDGVSRGFYSSKPIDLSLEPTSHTISAQFLGSYTDAPGQSAPVTFTIAKGNPVLELHSLPSLRESVQALAFSVKGTGAVGPGGRVQLLEGTTTIASGALVNGSAIVNVSLSRGVHDVRAVYLGDTRYREVSRNLRFEVLRDLPFPLEAHGMADGIRIAYILPPNAIAGTLQLHRRAAGTTEWAVVPGWNPVTGMDASVPKHGVTYEYRLLVTFKNASRSYSSIDSATLAKPRRRAVSP